METERGAVRENAVADGPTGVLHSRLQDRASDGAAAPVSDLPVVEIERRRYAKMQSSALALLAIGAFLTLIYFAKPVLVVMLVSTMIAFMLAPIADFGQRVLRLPRSVGALVAVVLFCGALYAITWVSYQRAVDFAQQLPKYSGKIRAVTMHFRRQAEQIQKTTEQVLPTTKEDKQAAQLRQAGRWSDWLSESAASLTEMLVLGSFVPFLVYFMLSWQEHVRTSTVLLFKMENRNIAYATIGQISHMIRSFIVGNAIVALFAAIASTIVFGILGLPYFYFIGVISGFLSVIPYLGIVLALIPPIVAGLGQMKPDLLLVIVITVVVLHVFAINVLYPKVIGRRMQLNPLAVTVALLFWGWLWGAMGLILAVPITAAIKIIFDHVSNLRPYGDLLGE